LLESLWQFGIISAVAVFGVKIGLAMGFANLSKKQVFLITAINGISIIVLSMLCEPYINFLYQIVYQYSSILFGLMAIIIFVTGYHTIMDWNKTHENHAKATCMAMVVPCPCCIGAVVGSVIIVAPMISVTTLFLGTYSAVILMVLIFVSYLLSDVIVKKINKPYPIVLGNFMMFVGLYFLIAMMILPNIGDKFSDKIQDINYSSPTMLLCILVVTLLIIGIGILYKKKYGNID